MPVKLKCKYCGKTYYRVPALAKNSLYCSRECHNKGRRKRVKVYCKICGKEKEVRYFERDRKYCNECNIKRFVKKSREKKGITKKCLICGKEFYTFPHYKHRKYCSMKCVSKAFKGKRYSIKTEFKKGLIPVTKGKILEQIHGNKKAKKIRNDLSLSHIGIKYKDRKKLSEKDRKKLSMTHLGFDINKYKDLIIRMYKQGKPTTYISKYIKQKYEPKSKMSYSVVITYLSKWGINIRKSKVPRIAFSWEKLCREVAKALYKQDFKNVSLPNKKIPDFALNEKRQGYYETIFDAKWHSYTKSINEDIKNYTPYCDKLEFWCLFGKINVNNPKVNIVSAKELINKLNKIGRTDLINKIELIKIGIDVYDKKQRKIKDF